MSSAFTTAGEFCPEFEPNSIIFDNADENTNRVFWPDRPRTTSDGDALGSENWATIAFHRMGPVPEELLATDEDTPLLRWTDPKVPAMPLLAAKLSPPTHRSKVCDRCLAPLRSLPRFHRLWVPGGQTMVEFQFCTMCHDLLNETYRVDLHTRLLVWR